MGAINRPLHWQGISLITIIGPYPFHLKDVKPPYCHILPLTTNSSTSILMYRTTYLPLYNVFFDGRTVVHPYPFERASIYKGAYVYVHPFSPVSIMSSLFPCSCSPLRHFFMENTPLYRLSAFPAPLYQLCGSLVGFATCCLIGRRYA